MDTIFDFFEIFIAGFSGFYVWFTTPIITIGGFGFTPLLFLTFGGLTTFLMVAIVKWGLS